MPNKTSLFAAWYAAGWSQPLTTLLSVLIGSFVCSIAVAQTSSSQTLPPPAWEPTGPRTTWRYVSFIVPPGMQGADKGLYYEMGGLGISGSIGRCGIFVLGEMPAEKDLPRQAQGLLETQLASLGLGVADAHGGPDVAAEGRVGRSPDGWEYIELSGMIKETVGGAARMMLAVRGPTVVPVLGLAIHGNGCVGLLGQPTANDNTITWAALFHSLRLAGSTPSEHLREQIVGTWSASSLSTGGTYGSIQGESYAANGQYGNAGTLGTHRGGAANESEFVTKHFAGDGRYVVAGNRLSIYPGRGEPQSNLIRIVEDYEARTTPKVTMRLCKVNIDVARKDRPYESCRDRQSAPGTH